MYRPNNAYENMTELLHIIIHYCWNIVWLKVQWNIKLLRCSEKAKLL